MCYYFKNVRLLSVKSPRTVRTLVRFVATVDLPVAVERARVGQLLAADLARDGRLPAVVGRRKRISVA